MRVLKFSSILAAVATNQRVLEVIICTCCSLLHCELMRFSGDTIDLPYDVQYRPPSEFSYDFGIKKLSGLNLDRYVNHCSQDLAFITPGGTESYDSREGNSALGFNGRQGKLLGVSATIDMDSRLTVGCAGAVLAHIGRHRMMDILPTGVENNAKLGIKDLQMFSIADLM